MGMGAGSRLSKGPGMSGYKPSQRRVRVDLLAIAGWISGTLHVPFKNSALATFNRKSEFLPMTDASAAPGEPPIHFLAMRRSAIVLAVPSEEELERPVAPQIGTHAHLNVRFHLHDSSVEGTVEALASLRISDFLETNPGFVVMSDCTLDEGGDVRRFSQLIVNTAHVLAVTEVHVGDRKVLVGV